MKGYDLDIMARSGSSVILTYVNSGGITRSVHNVTAVWDSAAAVYSIYNVPGDQGGMASYSTIEDYLADYSNGQLISMTQVWQRK